MIDSPEPPLAPATVLLVDDEEMVRRLTCKMLLRMGCRVIEAASGREALERIDLNDGLPIDLLLTDITMPGMDGCELAAAVYERHPSIKILMTSGFADVSELPIPPQGEFLHKPFALKDLTGKIRGLLSDKL